MKGKRVGVVIALAMMAVGTVYGQNITIYAVSRPAEKVFTEIMRQSGKNFVYTSDLLKDLTLSVDAKDKPLKEVLNSMFSTTDISFKIRGNNVMLFRKKKPTVRKFSIRRPK
ncbi:MAG: STN domain-containing protein, partial [Muribaculaceae bacterium]|nr:STN domain-containing protein [Muribaculaceae bacterium]